MGDRELANHVIDAAAGTLQQMGPTTEQLTQFQAELVEHSDSYTPELHELFSVFYGGSSPPVLTAFQLYDARALISSSDSLSEDLLVYSRSTELLAAQVRRHLSKTADDRDNIDRLLAGREEILNCGIVFDMTDLNGRWNEYIEDPDENSYEPPRATVVTYENLEITVEGEDDERRFSYGVDLASVTHQVPIYNFLAIERDQLVSNPNEETALTRYTGRVRAIRGLVDEVVRMQSSILEQLDVLASTSQSFTL